MRQSTCGSAGNFPVADARSGMSLNGTGGSSPSCGTSESHAKLPRRNRGGVPVFNRPSSNPSERNIPEIPTAVPSPTRPPSVRDSPVCMRARINVPVVNTTAPACNSHASCGAPNAQYTGSAMWCPARFRSMAASSTRTRRHPAGNRTPAHCGPLSLLDPAIALVTMSSTVPANTSIAAHDASNRCTSAA